MAERQVDDAEVETGAVLNREVHGGDHVAGVAGPLLVENAERDDVGAGCHAWEFGALPSHDARNVGAVPVVVPPLAADEVERRNDAVFERFVIVDAGIDDRDANAGAVVGGQARDALPDLVGADGARRDRHHPMHARIAGHVGHLRVGTHCGELLGGHLQHGAGAQALLDSRVVSRGDGVDVAGLDDDVDGLDRSGVEPCLQILGELGLVLAGMGRRPAPDAERRCEQTDDQRPGEESQLAKRVMTVRHKPVRYKNRELLGSDALL